MVGWVAWMSCSQSDASLFHVLCSSAFWVTLAAWVWCIRTFKSA